MRNAGTGGASRIPAICSTARAWRQNRSRRDAYPRESCDGCRDLSCDVLGCGDIRSLPEVPEGPLHSESLSRIHYFAHIGRYAAQQLQRRPSAALDREPHHICHAGQQLDRHKRPPYISPGTLLHFGVERQHNAICCASIDFCTLALRRRVGEGRGAAHGDFPRVHDLEAKFGDPVRQPQRSCRAPYFPDSPCRPSVRPPVDIITPSLVIYCEVEQLPPGARETTLPCNLPQLSGDFPVMFTVRILPGR